MTQRRRVGWTGTFFIAVSFVLLLLLIAITPAAADDDDDDDKKGQRGNQQDQILEAVRRGEIRSFVDIQAAAVQAMPGQVVGVEIERRKGRLVYEFKIVTAGGRVREVDVDAMSLDIVKVE